VPLTLAGYQFEIVAGERRYRAATLAKLETVPAIVRELTDAQVLEIMVIENNQREDVNALEEAEGFKRGCSKTGYDLEKLAERIGRSKKYVYDRHQAAGPRRARAGAAARRSHLRWTRHSARAAEAGRPAARDGCRIKAACSRMSGAVATRRIRSPTP
jgi:ParB-like chromosome segregation protein Spo0J